MSNDLVKRLRGRYVLDYDEANQMALCNDAADRIEQLEAAYAQQQQVWSDAIARADRYEAALRKIACDQQSVSCTCANESECSYGIARAALAGEKKDV